MLLEIKELEVHPEDYISKFHANRMSVLLLKWPHRSAKFPFPVSVDDDFTMEVAAERSVLPSAKIRRCPIRREYGSN